MRASLRFLFRLHANLWHAVQACTHHAVCVQVCCVIQGDGYMDACVRHTVLVLCRARARSCMMGWTTGHVHTPHAPVVTGSLSDPIGLGFSNPFHACRSRRGGSECLQSHPDHFALIIFRACLLPSALPINVQTEMYGVSWCHTRNSNHTTSRLHIFLSFFETTTHIDKLYNKIIKFDEIWNLICVVAG